MGGGLKQVDRSLFMVAKSLTVGVVNLLLGDVVA